MSKLVVDMNQPVLHERYREISFKSQDGHTVQVTLIPTAYKWRINNLPDGVRLSLQDRLELNKMVGL